MFGSSWSCGPKGVLIERERERERERHERRVKKDSRVLCCWKYVIEDLFVHLLMCVSWSTMCTSQFDHAHLTVACAAGQKRSTDSHDDDKMATGAPCILSRFRH
jgi:hypothetical protein